MRTKTPLSIGIIPQIPKSPAQWNHWVRGPYPIYTKIIKNGTFKSNIWIETKIYKG